MRKKKKPRYLCSECELILVSMVWSQGEGIQWSRNGTSTADQVLARPYPIFLSMYLPANLPYGVSIYPSTNYQSRPMHNAQCLAILTICGHCYSIILRGSKPLDILEKKKNSTYSDCGAEAGVWAKMNPDSRAGREYSGIKKQGQTLH